MNKIKQYFEPSSAQCCRDRNRGNVVIALKPARLRWLEKQTSVRIVSFRKHCRGPTEVENQARSGRILATRICRLIWCSRHFAMHQHIRISLANESFLALRNHVLESSKNDHELVYEELRLDIHARS